MKSSSQIIHVDMDAFFASVEILDNPDLTGKPVIVGGSPEKRGVVAAASYEARKFGIHSAMPTSLAMKLCPKAILLPGRMKRYVELSHQIREIFYRYTPQIEPISLDEAFLDISGSIQLFGPAKTIGQEIKSQIKEELGLIASVGIAPNKFLAKLASDLEKPDGFVIITEENKQNILDPLDISRIWGIGKVTEKALKSIGIITIEELRKTDPIELQDILGNSTGHILALAKGIDDREAESVHVSKSMSSEHTFATNVKDKNVLLNVLFNQVDEVAQRLRKEKLEAKAITLKLRYGNFRTVTRSNTLDKATNTTKILWEEAKEIFLKWRKISGGALRLLGFGASGLVDEGSGQKELFTNPEDKRRKKVDEVFDKIKEKYGDDSVKRGL